MKHLKSSVIATTLLLCCLGAGISCREHKSAASMGNAKVSTTELFRTSRSWDGAELPDYPSGRPELVCIRYEFPVGQKLGWHHHPVMNFGIVEQGELTIIGQDGREKVIRAGEAVVEMVGTIHRGENRGSVPVILNMFYDSQEGMPLSVQHPEIPMD